MTNHEDYFEGTSVKKISIIVACVISWMIIFGMFRSYAQDNVTENTPSASETLARNGDWPSQMIVDTVSGCFQGTMRWVLITNPVLLGQVPPPDAQRIMLVHCFCILDKIRVQYTFIEYFERYASSLDSEVLGTLFMKKAIECVKDYQTLEGLISVENLPVPDNQTTTKPEEPIEDSKEEVLPPKQPVEESEEESEDDEPNTLFQV